MIERGKRMKNIVGMPRVEFGRLEDTVDRMMEQCDIEKLPVYNDELYLELHRGCQTSQARTKRNNRKCELLFRDTEFLMTLAHLSGGTYENEALENAWKIVLTNQFHDILPGSSITEVYTTADEHYAQAKQAATQVLERTLEHLVTEIDTSGTGTPIALFNTLSWLRNDVVAAKVELPEGDFSVVDGQGEAVPHQVAADGDLLIDAQALPPLGYSVYRVIEDGPPAEAMGELAASAEAIENGCVRAEFDDHGRITRLYDKLFQREVLPERELANVLQLFDDRPQDWDAWEVDHNYDEIMWEPGPATSVEVIETGPVRAIVRFVRKTDHSVFTQDVVLHAGSPRIEFRTKVDWWEKKTLLKVAFPVDVRSSQATYEIQYGAIERPTHHNREYDRARFEVTAQRWADLSEGNYGVSLLNDCKYGHDVKGNVLRMSLLRSPVDPDPRADEGEHLFTYAIFPHGDDWRTATVQQACELNTPVIALEARASSGSLPAVDAFAAVDQENVVVDWVKRCEDSDDVIVRLYEAYGQRGPVNLTLARAPQKVAECNFMEEDDQPIEADGHTISFTIRPYEIRTFKLKFE
jgi:alpha-mannosidase